MRFANGIFGFMFFAFFPLHYMETASAQEAQQLEQRLGGVRGRISGFSITETDKELHVEGTTPSFSNLAEVINTINGLSDEFTKVIRNKVQVPRN
jgi:hypothetical protein